MKKILELLYSASYYKYINLFLISKVLKLTSIMTKIPLIDILNIVEVMIDHSFKKELCQMYLFNHD